MADNTVLLLDDDPAVRDAIKGMLPGGDYALLEVSDSKTALNVIKREVETLRLIVVKFKLPQIPGWKIIQKAQEHPKLQTIPMVLMVQDSDAVKKAFPQPPRFFHIVPYPCDRALFQGAVKAAVQKAKLPREGVAPPPTAKTPTPTPPPTAKKAPVQPPPAAKKKAAVPPPPAAKKAPAPLPPPAAKKKAAVPPPPPAAKRAPAPPPPPPAAAKKAPPPPPPAAAKKAAPPPAAKKAPVTPKTKPPAPAAPKAQPKSAPPKAPTQPKAQPKTASPKFDPVPFTGGDPFVVGDRVPLTPEPSWQSDDPFAAAVETTAPATVSDRADANDPFSASFTVTGTSAIAAADPNDPFLGEYVPDPFDPEPTADDPFAASDDPFAGGFAADPFDAEPAPVDDQDPFASTANFKAPPAMPPPTPEPPAVDVSDDDPFGGAIESLDSVDDDDDPFGDAVMSLGDDPVDTPVADPFDDAVESLGDDDGDPFGDVVMSLGDDLVDALVEDAAIDSPVDAIAPEPQTVEDAVPEAAESEDWQIPYADFECLHRYGEPRDRGVTDIVIGPEGAMYTCGPDLYICRWYLYELAKEQQFDLYSKGASCLALSPDGQVLITGAAKSNIKLWDALNGTLMDTLSDHSMGVTGLVMTPNAQTVISSSADSNIKLWDYATGDLQGPLNDESFEAEAVTITPDGSTVLSSSSQTNIRFWDFATGELLGPLNIQSLGVTSLVISPDGQAVISGDEQGNLTITSLATGEPIRTIKAHEEQPITAVAVSPDGWYIVTVSPIEMKLWGCWPEETGGE